MININLLPWREAIHKRLNRKLIFGITIQLILTMLVCVLIYFYTSYRAASAGPDRAMLNLAITQTTNKINQLTKYNKLLNEIKAQKTMLSNLNKNKYQALMIIQAVIQALPKTINLDRIVLKRNLNLYGTATTNKQVTQFITNLSKSGIINRPVLKEAKTLTKDDTIYIKFQVDAQASPMFKNLRVEENAKIKK